MLIQTFSTFLIICAMSVWLSRKGKNMAFAVHMFSPHIHLVLGTIWSSCLIYFLQVRAENSCSVSVATVIFLYARWILFLRCSGFLEPGGWCILCDPSSHPSEYLFVSRSSSISGDMLHKVNCYLAIDILFSHYLI